ncbi:hypothetical protein BDD41_3287 [Paracoccus versutus]|uniref:Uncharacterized protein n=1 Tax=Paracoccus versutus TaxID=34007 RepID=A0A3D9XCE4_PARVE|nr:hypothetical protein BDD41_3287 [Paracoccus versutus]
MRPRCIRRGVFALRRKRKDSGKIALNVDLDPILPRRQHDPVDQRADDLRRLDALRLVVALQRLVELLHPRPVLQRHRGMQQGRGLVGTGQEILQLRLAGAQLVAALLHRLDRDGVPHVEIHQLLLLAGDPLQFRLGLVDAGAAFHAQPVGLPRIGVAELGEEVGVDQAGAQGVQHPRFQLVAADVHPVVAGALVARRRAADQLLRDRRIAAAAAGALGQPRKQVFGPPAVVHLADVGDAARVPCNGIGLLPRLHGVPEIVVEDAQFRHLLDHPVLFRVGTRLALAGIGILDEALPVPDDPADIHLVVEDAVAALRVAVDRAEAPISARRGGDAVLVQCHGDGLGRFAGGIVAEDPAHHLGLRCVDRAVAAARLAIAVELLDHVVAVGIAAAGLAGLDPAALAAPGLVGQILQEQRVHRALQPDMQFADLALGEREHLHVGIAHALVDPGDVLLVAADPVQRLGQH